jgi:Domain of unknown function (DUF4407)
MSEDARDERERLSWLQPAPPDRTHARLLRSLTGADEDLLAQVPQERPRYTRLGGVILGTGVIAAVSMSLALGEVFDGTPFFAYALAIAWGLFIITIDAWLVSSLQGTRWRHRLWLIAPRLALAVVFGVLIAEPFVLRVFETAIERHVLDERQQQIIAFGTRLRECNTDSGQPPPAAVTRGGRCSSARVDVKGTPTPAALAAKVANLRHERQTLGTSIHNTTRHQTRLNEIARRECNGGSGRGLSGRFGVGPSCRRNRAEASEYERTSQAAAQARELVSVGKQITTATAALQVGADDYQRAVRAAISARIAERRSHQGPIGLLERLDALHSLTGENVYLEASEWLLRLFFITIDCLPLLVKLMGGTTSYDRLVDVRLASAERLFSEQERTEEEGRMSQMQLTQQRRERESEAERDALNTKMRLRYARQEVLIDDEIERLANQILDNGAASGNRGPGGFRDDGSEAS